ncbi:sigma-E factor negative regulatory protein [Paracidovorax sp. MALMAid1276]|uniref:sigma-E factor negative regulatory protein n=1 Tax=Paracidovorax sp. MALMAid1276 TaxID=3411631 RepID=UPI003B9D9BED
MNQAVAGNDGALKGPTKVDERDARCEQLSALADGELDGDEWAQALEFACEEQGQSTWAVYQLVGDVLRSPDLAQTGDAAFLARLRAQLAQEPVMPRPAVESTRAPAQGLVAAPAGAVDAAANASVFRWKMAAGFASLAAVAAIGWSSLATLQSPGAAAGAQLASGPEPSAPVIAVAEGDGQQVMIRDPRLDELLAAHKQFGSTSALQMPAGFLRNATFESPGR